MDFRPSSDILGGESLDKEMGEDHNVESDWGSLGNSLSETVNQVAMMGVETYREVDLQGDESGAVVGITRYPLCRISSRGQAEYVYKPYSNGGNHGLLHRVNEDNKLELSMSIWSGKYVEAMMVAFKGLGMEIVDALKQYNQAQFQAVETYKEAEKAWVKAQRKVRFQPFLLFQNEVVGVPRCHKVICCKPNIWLPNLDLGGYKDSRGWFQELYYWASRGSHLYYIGHYRWAS
ncbi:hypothetical protein V6N11_025365 [Hibiscus sabdariffa]|uniref:Uncharacterized protein n=1 Tax=Hibiscus sabdariffa TaxID=183260 RepID=A0ABR1ZIW7_9ROSI